MRAYYHDNVDTDQRQRHDSGHPVSADDLNKSGVLYYHLDSLDKVNEIARERSYKNRDEVCITEEGLGGKELYEQKLKMFYAEHLHEDEEIRYVLDGEGFFDVRSKPDDRWIRILVEKDDLLIVPAGIYHRFSPTTLDYIKALRLFKEEPKWEAKPRPVADSLPIRAQYLSA